MNVSYFYSFLGLGVEREVGERAIPGGRLAGEV